jgi:hypothetical protein
MINRMAKNTKIISIMILKLTLFNLQSGLFYSDDWQRNSVLKDVP